MRAYALRMQYNNGNLQPTNKLATAVSDADASRFPDMCGESNGKHRQGRVAVAGWLIMWFML